MHETLELRRYRMKPNRRDDLIALFEREFIESQEACGMVPIGHFRDLDDDDAFVWLRGFPRFDDRAAALGAFYIDSDAWKAHRDAANDTMIDSDDVLLLRPARPNSGFDLREFRRPSKDDPDVPARFTWVSAVLLNAPASEATIATFESSALPLLHEAASGTSYFVSELRANAFPRLPVREGEHAFVSCGTCATLDEVQACREIIDARFVPSLVEDVRNVEFFRLRPARRSLLR